MLSRSDILWSQGEVCEVEPHYSFLVCVFVFFLVLGTWFGTGTAGLLIKQSKANCFDI